MKKRIIATLLVLFTIISCVYPNASAYDLDETTESTSDSYYIDTSHTVKNITIMDPWGGVNYYAEFDGIEYYRYHCAGMNRDYHLGAILVHAEEE